MASHIFIVYIYTYFVNKYRDLKLLFLIFNIFFTIMKYPLPLNKTKG